MRVMRASEIGQYVFCHRAWWLGSVRGEPSANVPRMQMGTRVHERHGMRVAVSRVLVLAGYAALAAALVLLYLSFAHG